MSAVDVDRYVAAAPDAARPGLEELRRTIKSAAPEAEELISYQIPTFKLGGRPLVAYGVWKSHLGFYLMSGDLMEKYATELKPYRRAKATIGFSIATPLPVALVKKLVKARIAENEAAGKKQRG